MWYSSIQIPFVRWLRVHGDVRRSVSISVKGVRGRSELSIVKVRWWNGAVLVRVRRVRVGWWRGVGAVIANEL